MYFLGILLMIAGMVVGWILKRKFERYSQVRMQSNLSGAEVAKMMLSDHGIFDVVVTSVDGKLTDHYNPADKTVNLSYDVYHGRNAAAAAVAAHEVGHAVQHATAYSMLQFRSSMVPLLSVTSNVMPWILLAGVLTLQYTPIPLMFGVLLFGATTLFSFVTLPVEFDASARALKWIQNRNITTADEYVMAKDALWWAATTYVVSALASLAMLLHYVGLLRSRD